MGGGGRLMAKTNLNFHFDYWNPSLNKKIVFFCFSLSEEYLSSLGKETILFGKSRQRLQDVLCLCLCLTPCICHFICLSYLYYNIARHRTFSLSSSRHQNASRVGWRAYLPCVSVTRLIIKNERKLFYTKRLLNHIHAQTCAVFREVKPDQF